MKDKLHIETRSVSQGWVLQLLFDDKVKTTIWRGSYLQCSDFEKELNADIALTELIRLFNSHGEQQTLDILIKYIGLQIIK